MSRRRYLDWDDEGRWGWYYEPSVPLPVRGGIKARSQRGSFARSWWSRRWLEALEEYNSPSRMARGRTYARMGQVISLEAGRGLAVAQVQGSRRRPYRVELRLRMATDGEKEAVLAAAAGQPVIAARLLAGEVPPELEDAFGAAGIPLFPVDDRDMQTRCTCPDAANPCKHIAAVYYLLAEAIDDNPGILLQLRGFDVREFIAALGDASDAKGGDGAKARDRKQVRQEAGEPDRRVRGAGEATEAEGLIWDGDPAAFWGDPARGDGLALPSLGPHGSAAPAPALMVKGRLGAFPFWQGDVALKEALAAFYFHGADTGTRLLAGEGLARPAVSVWGPHRSPSAHADRPGKRPAAGRDRPRRRRREPGEGSPPMSATVSKRPFRRPSLRAVLVDNLGDLAVIVADWGLALSPADERLVERTPRMALETVHNRLSSPQAIAGAARQLSPLARELVAFIVRRGGAATVEDALEHWAGGNRKRLGWAVRDAASVHLLFLQADGRVHGHRYPERLVDRPDTMLFIPVTFARHLQQRRDSTARDEPEGQGGDEGNGR